MHSLETRTKMSEARKKFLAENPTKHNFYKDGHCKVDNRCVDCNKAIRWEAKRCKGCEISRRFKEGNVYKIKFGPDNPGYKGGITPLHISIRTCDENLEWIQAVLKRDNYTCQDCGYEGSGDLEVHHIKRFSIILAEFLKKYDQFSPVEDKETLLKLAIKYKPFWYRKNGETLCKDCHNLTRG